METNAKFGLVSVIASAAVALACCGVTYGQQGQTAEAPFVPTGKNMLKNGSFDDPEGAFKWWCVDYEWSGNELYVDNKYYVGLEDYLGKQNVACMRGTKPRMYNQGVKMDSWPVAIPRGKGQYKLTMSVCCSGGVFSRIRVDGMMWEPGIKPHPNPDFKEVRPVWRSKIMQFAGGDYDPNFPTPPKTWQTFSVVFPDVDKMSGLNIKSFKRVDFLSVHITAFDGAAREVETPYFYVDNVKIERLK